MDFNFNHEVPANRFREIEYNFSVIIENLNKVAKGESENNDEIQALAMFSNYLYNSYLLLKIYLDYKHDIKSAKTDEEKDVARLKAISDIELIEIENKLQGGTFQFLLRISLPARLHNKVEHEYIGKL